MIQIGCVVFLQHFLCFSLHIHSLVISLFSFNGRSLKMLYWNFIPWKILSVLVRFFFLGSYFYFSCFLLVFCILLICFSLPVFHCCYILFIYLFNCFLSPSASYTLDAFIVFTLVGAFTVVFLYAFISIHKK